MTGIPGIHVVAASARIAAPPGQLYAIIADYRHGHPRILPPQFRNLSVERGGTGAGTIIRFQLRIFGVARAFRAAITEPEPGRVLAETNLEGRHSVTTFTIDGVAGGRATDVTIATRLSVAGGLKGALECFLCTKILRSIYAQELLLLRELAIDEN